MMVGFSRIPAHRTTARAGRKGDGFIFDDVKNKSVPFSLLRVFAHPLSNFAQSLSNFL
jgi:hypothetical protein